MIAVHRINLRARLNRSRPCGWSRPHSGGQRYTCPENVPDNWRKRKEPQGDADSREQWITRFPRVKRDNYAACKQGKHPELSIHSGTVPGGQSDVNARSTGRLLCISAALRKSSPPPAV